MVLLIVAAAVLGVVVLGVAAWFLLPTIRSSRTDFEPVSKDDDSVFQAQQSFTTGAGGAGAGT
jgi:hypothetical protein